MATLFDGKSSAAQNVLVRYEHSDLQIINEQAENIATIPKKNLQIEPLIGKTIRVINANGLRLETKDQNAVATLEQKLGINKGMNIVGKLESRWQLVMVCLLGLLVAMGLFWKYGLPWLADKVAFATPISASVTLSEESMKILNSQFFTASKLPIARRQELNKIFTKLSNSIGNPNNQKFPYRIEFKDGGPIGANAFALPGGIVVMTDQLVEMSKDDKELEGVLAHEVGHVIKRHTLRSLYQNVGLLFMISAVVGDFASITSVGATLPASMINNGFSRDAEREADAVAGAYLMQRYKSTAPLRNLFKKLLKKNGNEPVSFLNNHPGAKERIATLKKLEGK